MGSYERGVRLEASAAGAVGGGAQQPISILVKSLTLARGSAGPEVVDDAESVFTEER